jgi:dienelactone hydrolase
VIGLLVFGHRLLDYLEHAPDLPLEFDRSARVGLGLEGEVHWTRALMVEGGAGRRDRGLPEGPRMTTPAVPGFDQVPFAHQGRSHPVYRAGSGPAVIVIHEIPGIHPGMIGFARRLLDAGYTVYLPSLFGRPGGPGGTGSVLRSILRVCVSREFAILADRTSPVVTWLRALAAQAQRECGGPGVGAIGMCLTGGFALAMAVEPAVWAPVASQPGLPAPLTARKRAAVGLDATDLAQVLERTRGGLCVLGLRFSADRGCPAERFQRLHRELGEGFEAIEVDSSPGNPWGIPQRAHAVLTVDLVDEPGHPTRAALDRVLEFLDQRLHP